MDGSDQIALEELFELPTQETATGRDDWMSTHLATSAFGVQGRRAVFLATTFLRHVHERDDGGMRAILRVVNSSGLVSEFVAALAAVAVALGRRVYGEEELGQALQDFGIRLNRESLNDHAPDSP